MFLKKTSSYILVAYNHHNFQSDNRKLSRTIKTKKDRFIPAFFVLNVSSEKIGLSRDCVSNPKVRSRLRRAIFCEAAETSRAPARDIRSAAPVLKELLLRCFFAFVGLNHQKSDLMNPKNIFQHNKFLRIYYFL